MVIIHPQRPRGLNGFLRDGLVMEVHLAHVILHPLFARKSFWFVEDYNATDCEADKLCRHRHQLPVFFPRWFEMQYEEDASCAQNQVGQVEIPAQVAVLKRPVTGAGDDKCKNHYEECHFPPTFLLRSNLLFSFNIILIFCFVNKKTRHLFSVT